MYFVQLNSMDFKKDAYGQQIWSFYQKKEGFELVERDDKYINLSMGAPRYFAPYKDWPEREKKAIKFAKGKVLDIGSGAGRVSLYLQKKGLDVLGIDNSPLAVKVCKKRGVKARVLPIEKVDQLDQSFNTILMFGNGFGLFGSFKKARKLFNKLFKITTSEALIIAESTDPYKTEESCHLNYHKLNKKRGRMPGQLRIRIRFKEYVGDWFDYLLVSKKEMKEILKGTGWRVKEFIDSKNSIYFAIIEKNEI